MGTNKELRKRRAGKLRALKEHRRKIGEEMAKSQPNQERIRHWQKEIENWTAQIEDIDRKLRQH